jgi:hypothetical protein
VAQNIGVAQNLGGNAKMGLTDMADMILGYSVGEQSEFETNVITRETAITARCHFEAQASLLLRS